MEPTVTRDSAQVAIQANGRPVNPARLGCVLVMMLSTGFVIFYSLAAPYLSGHRVTDFPLQSSPALQLPGATLVQSGPRKEMAGPIALDPSMNRIAMVVHVGHDHVNPLEHLRCAVTVRDSAGRVVWDEEHVILSGRTGRSAVGGGHLSAMLGEFDVPAADQYTFDVRFMSQYVDVVRSADLEIRRNVSGASLTVIGVGLAIAFAAFVGFLITGRRDGPTVPLAKAA